MSLSGVIKVTDAGLVFQKDYLFNSPSMAGAVITGSSSNGWRDWKDENGRTLDECIRQTDDD